MTNIDYDRRERDRVLVSKGTCPECGGKLDAARPLRNFFLKREIKQRQCYDCLSIFYVEEED